MTSNATIAEALRELDLYADTDEAEAGRILLAALDLNEIDSPVYSDNYSFT
jgi:hypothetical protein